MSERTTNFRNPQKKPESNKPDPVSQCNPFAQAQDAALLQEVTAIPLCTNHGTRTMQRALRVQATNARSTTGSLVVPRGPAPQLRHFCGAHVQATHWRRVHASRPSVLARASSPEPLPESSHREEGPLDGALPAVQRWWAELSRIQKVSLRAHVGTFTWTPKPSFAGATCPWCTSSAYVLL